MCKCTDIVTLISAEKIGDAWRFYSRGNPDFHYILREGQTTRYSFDELSLMTTSTLMSDGLVGKFNKCKINNGYIERKWFPDEREDYYQKFLRSQ